MSNRGPPSDDPDIGSLITKLNRIEDTVREVELSVETLESRQDQIISVMKDNDNLRFELTPPSTSNDEDENGDETDPDDGDRNGENSGEDEADENGTANESEDDDGSADNADLQDVVDAINNLSDTLDDVKDTL
ncbi:hypothetical protein [Candidatus Halobonum tyrrellensis]|uniref:hypothetical protein n=1 Tax=Candidatus Halobonum tyrrellensis TaxID=1431545 RepID=UPI0012689CB7|nr:hypothetical protein [Candidatus Halobonum tyrrellensis]